MRNRKEITENEMILEFLSAELESVRFRKNINESLHKLGYKIELITNADLNSKNENKQRKELFKMYRDYENEDGLFEGFPKDIKWFETEMSKSELLEKVLYIDYSYWNELSKGTRLPVEAAKTIKAGVKIYRVSNEGFINASNQFRNGKQFRKLIIMTDGNTFVILEGHLRLTVYAMNPDLLPDYIPVVLGYSDNINKWSCF